MDQFYIEPTNQTPEIDFDAKNGVFKIKGKSYPENVNVCYEPVFKYLDAYILNPQAKTTLEFNWLYYSTSTNKMIVRIILLLLGANTELNIIWQYQEGFEMIMEKGLELGEVLKHPITLQKINS